MFTYKEIYFDLSFETIDHNILLKRLIFLCSLLLFIQLFTSCADWISSSTCCGAADFCTWVSSAKEWWRPLHQQVVPCTGRTELVQWQSPGAHPKRQAQSLTSHCLQIWIGFYQIVLMPKTEEQCRGFQNFSQDISKECCDRWSRMLLTGLKQ